MPGCCAWAAHRPGDSSSIACQVAQTATPATSNVREPGVIQALLCSQRVSQRVRLWRTTRQCSWKRSAVHLSGGPEAIIMTGARRALGCKWLTSETRMVDATQVKNQELPL